MNDSKNTLSDIDDARIFKAMVRINKQIVSAKNDQDLVDFLARETVRAGLLRSLMVAIVEGDFIQVKCNVVREGGEIGGNRKIKSEAKDQEVIGTKYHVHDNNITAITARKGTVQILENWESEIVDRKFDTSPEAWNDKVAVFVPIVLQGEVLAVLGTGCQRSEKEMVLERIEHLQPLWHQVAIALGFLRLGSEYESIKQRNEGMKCKLDVLTKREKQTLCLLAEGFSTKQMADQMGVSIKTIETYRRNLRNKLDLYSVADLTLFALQVDLVKI